MVEFQFVGVDVAKDKFDAALNLGNKYRHDCFSNDAKGYRAFHKWLDKHTNQPWICMEATGHYSELIADYLFAEQFKVSIVNPLQIKNFARAKLSRNKTDKLDAAVIADYCEKMKPAIFESRSDEQKELKELSNLLDMLKGQYTQLSNQLDSARSETARRALRKLLKNLEKEIKRVECLIAEVIKCNKDLHQNLKLMTSIKGVGKLTAYKVLSHVPHMNSFRNAKQFAAFIGISPRQNQSGNFQGKTSISRLGNSALRKSFYMAAMVAIRHNKLIQPFVARLKQNGKAPKAIICAVMRKLAHFIFGIIKNKRPFDVEFA